MKVAGVQMIGVDRIQGTEWAVAGCLVPPSRGRRWNAVPTIRSCSLSQCAAWKAAFPVRRGT
ncbi:MAG: hypothetical protein IJQ00_09680 [Kiritimatiellae bacterium]|nr:hypothetical protein [Kiritimatiellia bacterium]